jgi:hypothetical protein
VSFPSKAVILSIFPDLVKKFESARQQLVNSRLFIEVVVALKSIRGYLVDVSIDVKERWYIFPIPYVKPVDRNLSEWAKQGYGTDRLNYGFKFTHYNLSGRNDKLRLWLITGYSKQISFNTSNLMQTKHLSTVTSSTFPMLPTENSTMRRSTTSNSFPIHSVT